MVKADKDKMDQDVCMCVCATGLTSIILNELHSRKRPVHPTSHSAAASTVVGRCRSSSSPSSLRSRGGTRRQHQLESIQIYWKGDQLNEWSLLCHIYTYGRFTKHAEYKETHINTSLLVCIPLELIYYYIDSPLWRRWRCAVQPRLSKCTLIEIDCKYK